MKRYLSLFLLALMFCAIVSIGCGGGGSDSADPEQTESLNDDTGSTDPNSGGRGTIGETIDLSTLTTDYTAQNGETLTGTLRANVKISIADRATVTLEDITIQGVHHYRYKWAGITCEGDANIILEGTNSVKGFYDDYPGIHAAPSKTLTIMGNGSLTASSNGDGAGIGGGFLRDCGNITIMGGSITATGGDGAAGIGGGEKASCGNITITDAIVIATMGRYARYSVGEGFNGSCGTVTIEGKVGAISESPFRHYPETKIINLSTLTANYTAQHDDMLTGTLGANVKVSIADGATIILKDATINGVDGDGYDWAGITCEGNATIMLEGTNSVRGFHKNYPGIYVPRGKTLTIKGKDSLTASSNGSGAGIGGGYNITCGNIVIEGGSITATGGSNAAGLGSGFEDNCGNIKIAGGIITATGGDGAAGIGSGFHGICGSITITAGIITATGGSNAAGIGSGSDGSSDNITITDGIVKATKGQDASYSISAGRYSNSGTVTIGDKTGPISESPYEYYPETKMIDLSTLTADYTAQNGEILTGTLGAIVKVSIADGATVILKGATINGTEGHSWAGISCAGDATLFLEGFNYVKGFDRDYPGIHVPEGNTLTIKGNGLLNATSNGYAAGIGGGNRLSCGNIVLDGGTIYATGGMSSAGIGGGSLSNCGDITIKDSVYKVTAIKGDNASYSIGAGSGNCGKITVGEETAAGKLGIYTHLGKGSNDFGTIDLHIKIPRTWEAHPQSGFYGKTSAGVWEKLVYNWSSDTDKKISKEYVAFGLDIDGWKTTNWPYSGVFWEADGPSRPDRIDIILENGYSSPNVEIKVDGKRVVYDDNCSNGTRYDWAGTGKVINVTTYKTGAYLTTYNSQNFYARKSGGKWERLFSGANSGNHDFYIDGDYVEFGFEFSIQSGATWPFSEPFWWMHNSEEETVKKIHLSMEGTAGGSFLSFFGSYPYLYIYVNGNQMQSYSGKLSSYGGSSYWGTQL